MNNHKVEDALSRLCDRQRDEIAKLIKQRNALRESGEETLAFLDKTIIRGVFVEQLRDAIKDAK